MAERARRRLDSRYALQTRVLGERAAVSVVGVEQRGVEEASLGERDIERGGRVALGEDEAVSVRIERVGRIDAQRAPVGGHEQIDARQRRAEVGRLGRMRHFHDPGPNPGGDRGEFRNVHHGRC